MSVRSSRHKIHSAIAPLSRPSALAAIVIGGLCVRAPAADIGDVFIIHLENHNWTQPNGNVAVAGGSAGAVAAAGIQQLYKNSAAPFINSLVTPENPNAAQVSYCSKYYNVLASEAGPDHVDVHPSEPSYIYSEAGHYFGVLNDNDPYAAANGSVEAIRKYVAAHPGVGSQSLTGLLQARGIAWKSYQEDTDLATTGLAEVNGNQAARTYKGRLPDDTLTDAPVAPAQYTVPLTSFLGTSNKYTNAYNGSHMYNFAAKHDGSLFFPDSTGGDDPTPANKQAAHWAPLQQLKVDLADNSVGRYNLITPDQYNEMHTRLPDGFTYKGIHYTGDAAQIAAGDNCISQLVAMIQASAAYKNNGVIVIWTDETELDSTRGNRDDFKHTLAEIIISPLARGNAYESTLKYDHGSDLRTWQEVFGVRGSTPGGYLNMAATARDLGDLFVAGTVPGALP
jgi:hypothetical protein